MIAVMMANGYECVEALCPYDLLKRAGCDVRFVSIDGKYAEGGCNVRITCDMDADELLASDERIEMLVLPGGMPGAANLDSFSKINAIIEKTEKDGGFFAAICAAPMVYGKRGMLKGKAATAFPSFREYLIGADVKNAPVVRDGRFITAAGMGAAYPFGIELVRALLGDDAAERLERDVCAK